MQLTVFSITVTCIYKGLASKVTVIQTGSTIFNFYLHSTGYTLIIFGRFSFCNSVYVAIYSCLFNNQWGQLNSVCITFWHLGYLYFRIQCLAYNALISLIRIATKSLLKSLVMFTFFLSLQETEKAVSRETELQKERELRKQSTSPTLSKFLLT